MAMSDLNTDPWIASNSEIHAEKLHAIGVISFQWNRCEFWLFHLFCQVSELPEAKAWTLVFDLGDVSICTRIGVLMASRTDLHPDAVALITNALAIYDLCRQNRNSVVHAWTVGSGSQAPLARKSKKPDQLDAEPFPCELNDLRRVAEEIQWLSRRLFVLNYHFEQGSMATALPSPRKLPLPELLWKPPPQDSIKPKRPPRPSRASRKATRNALVAKHRASGST
jgi:hypothetical protein